MRHGPWPGTWKVVCDVCGFQFHSGVIKKRWDGLMVCHKDYELDHPQKFIRVRAESGSPSFVRPEPEPIYINYCNLEESQAIAGLGIAGCARAGYNANLPR
jgi:hypothetical protein